MLEGKSFEELKEEARKKRYTDFLAATPGTEGYSEASKTLNDYEKLEQDGEKLELEKDKTFDQKMSLIASEKREKNIAVVNTLLKLASIGATVGLFMWNQDAGWKFEQTKTRTSHTFKNGEQQTTKLLWDKLKW